MRARVHQERLIAHDHAKQDFFSDGSARKAAVLAPVRNQPHGGVDVHTCQLRRKSPTAGDLGKQLRVQGAVLFHRLRGLTGDQFDVMSGAVVAVLAMPTRHDCEVLLNKFGQARGPQVFAHPVVVGDVFRAVPPR